MWETLLGYLVGVSSTGPVAGGLFATAQSAWGTTAVMSAVQSAAMGGPAASTPPPPLGPPLGPLPGSREPRA